MRRIVVPSLFFVGLAGPVEQPPTVGGGRPFCFPRPGALLSISGALLDGTLLEAIWVTMKRLLVGYAIGVLIGLPLGLLTSSSQMLEDTVGALALGLQTLPSVCWVPLALLWFGQTEGAMLFVVVMGTVWSVIIATDHGARTIPPIYARAARTMGSERAASVDHGDAAGIACRSW